MQTINLYTSVPAGTEVLQAARGLRLAGHAVQVRPLAELPQPAPGHLRRRYFLEDEAPAPAEGGVGL